MINQLNLKKPFAPQSYPISELLITFTIERISSTIRCEEDLLSSRSFPPFSQFVRRVIRKCGVQTSVLLIALIYVDRLRKYLPTKAIGTPTTGHRIFLASILLASKFHEDASLWCVDIADFVDKYWNISEIIEMERVLLDYLKFDLWVDRAQLSSYIKQENIQLDTNEY